MVQAAVEEVMEGGFVYGNRFLDWMDSYQKGFRIVLSKWDGYVDPKMCMNTSVTLDGERSDFIGDVIKIVGYVRSVPSAKHWEGVYNRRRDIASLCLKSPTCPPHLRAAAEETIERCDKQLAKYAANKLRGR